MILNESWRGELFVDVRNNDVLDQTGMYTVMCCLQYEQFGTRHQNFPMFVITSSVFHNFFSSLYFYRIFPKEYF